MSVEHSFSGLKCISSDLSILFTSEMLDKIMIVGSNYIFDTIILKNN